MANDVLELMLLLSDITARITASEFREHEIVALDMLVLEYLDKRKRVHESCPDLLGTPKPKESHQI